MGDALEGFVAEVGHDGAGGEERWVYIWGWRGEGGAAVGFGGCGGGSRGEVEEGVD